MALDGGLRCNDQRPGRLESRPYKKPTPVRGGYPRQFTSCRRASLSARPVLGTASTPRYTVLPTARANAAVSATSTPQHRTGRRNGVSAPNSFGDCCRLCRGAYLGTVAAPTCAVARYERRSLPAGRTTTGTTDLERLLAWPHGQRGSRRSSHSQPCSPLTLPVVAAHPLPAGEGRGEGRPTTLPARSRSRSRTAAASGGRHLAALPAPPYTIRR